MHKYKVYGIINYYQKKKTADNFIQTRNEKDY